MQAELTNRFVFEQYIAFLQNHSFKDYDTFDDLMYALMCHKYITDIKTANELIASVKYNHQDGTGVILEALKGAMQLFNLDNKNEISEDNKASISVYLSYNFSDPREIINLLLSQSAIQIVALGVQNIGIDNNTSITQATYVRIVNNVRKMLDDMTEEEKDTLVILEK